jgi:hypothetical protein
MKQFLKFKHRMMMIGFVFISVVGLSACGQSTHEPRIGEYGENLVNSVLLTPTEIQELNQAVITKPKDTFDRPNVGISFSGDHARNPYRFVIVAKGTVMHEGRVELKWIGGVQSEASIGYQPEVFQAEDGHKYDINQPVLLVIGSDPFSVSEKGNGMIYGIHAELMEAENFQFQSVEVQIWQGKATTYSWIYYLKFLLIFMAVILGIYSLTRHYAA